MQSTTGSNPKIVVGIIIGTVILIVAFIFINSKMNGGEVASVDLSTFAQCLKDKGATFYGAYWCPHCAAQKHLFGSAAKLLPYQECSTPDGSSQNALCNSKSIQHYPTWVFADGTRVEGSQSVQNLSKYSGCPLPAGAENLAPPEGSANTSASQPETTTGSTTNQ